MNTKEALITLQDVSVTYPTGTHALQQINLQVGKGEFVAVMGPSGSGKTTLLNCISCYIPIDSGEIMLGDRQLANLSEDALAKVRNRQLGFVFQDFNLLDTFTLRDNIFLPLVLAGKSYEEMSGRIGPIAQRLGIAQLLGKYPYEVSGGEKQRVAIARALAKEPAILFCDEPTGALDEKNGKNVLRILQDLNRCGTTVIVVTHLLGMQKMADHVIRMIDGEIKEDIRNTNTIDAEDVLWN